MLDKASAKIFEKSVDCFVAYFPQHFFLFFLLFFFPNNIYREVQNKIRNICNKKQLFILLLSLPTSRFSVQIFQIFLFLFLSWFSLSLFGVHFLTTDFFDLPVITSVSLNNMLMLLFHCLTNLDSVDLFPSNGNLACPHHFHSLLTFSQYRYVTSKSSIYKFN